MSIEPQLVEMDQRRRRERIIDSLQKIVKEFIGVCVLAHDERAHRVFDRTDTVTDYEITDISASRQFALPSRSKPDIGEIPTCVAAVKP